MLSIAFLRAREKTTAENSHRKIDFHNLITGSNLVWTLLNSGKMFRLDLGFLKNDIILYKKKRISRKLFYLIFFLVRDLKFVFARLYTVFIIRTTRRQ